MGDILPNASASTDFLWRVGYSLKMAQTVTRCSYDNQTCYEVKAVARIDAISASSGYTTGNQLLTVTGLGFNSPNISATVDGVPCQVTYYDRTRFTCLTGPQPSPSNLLS